LQDAGMRRRFGMELRRKVEHEYSAAATVPRWQAVFDEVISEHI